MRSASTVSMPYDATAKDLLEAEPAGLAALLGVVRPSGKIRLVDSDLSTVSAAADKILRIEDDSPWLLHVEFQSSRDLSLPRRMLQYNALLHERHKLLVASVLLLLTPKAEAATYTGEYAIAAPFGPSWSFAYSVLRVWEWSAEAILEGPLALLPLAPIAKVARDQVSSVIGRIDQRLVAESDSPTANRVATAIGILLQLRYGAMTAEELIRTVPDIREFGAFRPFIEQGEAKGQLKGLQSGILLSGRGPFGAPSESVEQAIRAINSVSQLEGLCTRLSKSKSWDELLNPVD